MTADRGLEEQLRAGAVEKNYCKISTECFTIQACLINLAPQLCKIGAYLEDKDRYSYLHFTDEKWAQSGLATCPGQHS